MFRRAHGTGTCVYRDAIYTLQIQYTVGLKCLPLQRTRQYAAPAVSHPVCSHARQNALSVQFIHSSV